MLPQAGLGGPKGVPHFYVLPILNAEVRLAAAATIS